MNRRSIATVVNPPPGEQFKRMEPIRVETSSAAQNLKTSSVNTFSGLMKLIVVQAMVFSSLLEVEGVVILALGEDQVVEMGELNEKQVEMNVEKESNENVDCAMNPVIRGQNVQ